MIIFGSKATDNLNFDQKNFSLSARYTVKLAAEQVIIYYYSMTVVHILN